MHMELIKENKDKHRAVYKLDDGNYKKYWYDKDLYWIYRHVEILNKIMPGYVLDHGTDLKGAWAVFKQLKGFPANLREHTDEFMLFVYEGCLKNIKETAPYSHGDWVLSNIYIEGDQLHFCDWDNVGMYAEELSLDKMHRDLHSAFGDRFYKVIGYDPAGF